MGGEGESAGHVARPAQLNTGFVSCSLLRTGAVWVLLSRISKLRRAQSLESAVISSLPRDMTFGSALQVVQVKTSSAFPISELYSLDLVTGRTMVIISIVLNYLEQSHQILYVVENYTEGTRTNWRRGSL